MGSSFPDENPSPSRWEASCGLDIAPGRTNSAQACHPPARNPENARERILQGSPTAPPPPPSPSPSLSLSAVEEIPPTAIESAVKGEAEETAEGMPSVSVSSPSPRRAHLFHLVIKHHEVAQPVSRGRNKGEVITRSYADALEIASFIRARHETRAGKGGLWTPEEFAAAVGEFCELASARRGGDLGVVEEGTFAEAFDAAAFALRRGEVSKPVATPLGIHLIYRCD
ncbi:unnamed protein product [Phytomonas sp. EM1]|nr:unnamed protein product [Phytomonas sp. EM1]|eukprot:CCW65551.1 unnamed protein product [Phytomonas sp. isolate EM1]